MRNNVFISRAMFKLPRVIKRGSPYGFAYKQIISAKIGEDGDANEGKYGNVHITMVNGGPVIELFCEPDESKEESDGDIGQLNAFFDILELEPESTERYQLTNIDGEDVFIRIGSIAMVRVPLDVLEPVEEDDI